MTTVRSLWNTDSDPADSFIIPGALAVPDGITAPVNAVSVAISGLSGATTATRLAGGTASGDPLTGTFALGDIVNSRDGSSRVCIGAGSPGTWRQCTPINTPGILMPAASFMNGAASVAAWPAANRAIFTRFQLPNAATLRYLNLRIGVSSGNIQVGVISLSGPGHLDYTRVMDTGIIPTPGAGAQKIDLTAATLPAGDYAAYVWADNGTVTIPNAGVPGGADAYRLLAEVSNIAGGVPANGTLPSWAGARFITLGLEGDV